MGAAGVGGDHPVLLSGRLSRRSKNVIRPAIDWAAPAWFLPFFRSLPLSLVSPIVSEGPRDVSYVSVCGRPVGILEGRVR